MGDIWHPLFLSLSRCSPSDTTHKHTYTLAHTTTIRTFPFLSLTLSHPSILCSLRVANPTRSRTFRLRTLGENTCLNFFSASDSEFQAFSRPILTATSLHLGETFLEDERSQARLGGYDSATYQIMPPRREPRTSSESNFPDIGQLGEAIANVIQSSLRLPQWTPLESIYNLKLNNFVGTEGPEETERWLNHVEKTYRVMQRHENLPEDRWVEMTTSFIGEEVASWWRKESFQLSLEEAADWEVFKQLFQKRFVPPEYIDRKKQEFTHLKQGKMSTNEYYGKFIDLSRYCPEIAENPAEMLRRFKWGTRKKWRSIATMIPCSTCQEFYEILLRVEDSEMMPSDSEEEEEKDNNQKKNNNKDKGQSSHGPRKMQSFKRSGTSSGSSSEGTSSKAPWMGGRSGGSRFQRQMDFSGSGDPFYRRYNGKHFGDCRQGSRGCFVCGWTGHRAVQCPQNQQKSQPPALPPAVPLQQVPGPSAYTSTSYGGAYHYQGDVAPYSGGQYQYPHDLYHQSGYAQYPGGYTPYPPYSGGGSQWYPGWQSQNVKVASRSAGLSRQPNQPGQGRGLQRRGNQTNRGLRGRQQPHGHVHHITLQDAWSNPDLIMNSS